MFCEELSFGKMRNHERCHAFPEMVDPRILSIEMSLATLFQIPIRSEAHEHI